MSKNKERCMILRDIVGISKYHIVTKRLGGKHIRIPKRVVPSEKIVIATYINCNKPDSIVLYNTLAKRAGCSLRAVYTYLRRYKMNKGYYSSL